MSLGGVWVPGGGDTPQEDYQNALERACSIMVHFGGLDAMRVVADADSYLSETLEQVRAHPDIGAETAADWLESEDRMELPLPEADCEFFGALDDASARAFRSDGLSATAVVDIYEQWLIQTKREFETAHGLPEGWADVEVDDEQWR